MSSQQVAKQINNKQQPQTNNAEKAYQNEQHKQVQQKQIPESQNQTTNPIQSNNKWQKLIQQNQKQDQQTPFILKQQSFKTENQTEQYNRQKFMMQQAARKGRQFLIQKNYQLASKQLSKTLMAFQFIAKNHFQTVQKQQIKGLMISTVLPAYNNLALCYLKMKNYELVVSFTNQVLGQDHDNVKARYRRALAYKQLKNTDEAINDFQFVIKLDPQMKNDCNQKIKECKLIQIQQKKKRKLAAQKFLSGYQSDDIKVTHSQKKQREQQTQDSRDESQPVFKVDEKFSIVQWIKEKCQNCSKLLSMLRLRKTKEEKEQ